MSQENTAGTPIDEGIKSLLTLRLAVGLLGEQGNHGWWKSRFSVYGKRALVLSFPRSYRIAIFKGTGEAALRVHQQVLDNRSHHLFRLHQELDSKMRDALLTPEGQELFDAVLENRESAESHLTELAARHRQSAEGAANLGPSSVDNVMANVGRMARIYKTAFDSGAQAFPFFSQDKA